MTGDLIRRLSEQGEREDIGCFLILDPARIGSP